MIAQWAVQKLFSFRKANNQIVTLCPFTRDFLDCHSPKFCFDIPNISSSRRLRLRQKFIQLHYSSGLSLTSFCPSWWFDSFVWRNFRHFAEFIIVNLFLMACVPEFGSESVCLCVHPEYYKYSIATPRKWVENINQNVEMVAKALNENHQCA